LGTSNAKADSSCTADGRVCIEGFDLADGKGLELWAESRRPGAVTLTLEEETENLIVPAGMPKEISFAQPARRRLGVLLVADENQAWKHTFRFHCISGNTHAVHDEGTVYEMPFAQGLSSRISQGSHGKFSHSDLGNAYAVDFEVPEGTAVHAARGGIVVEVEQGHRNGGPNESVGNANVIRIEHGDGTIGEYGHLRFQGASVKVGQVVRAKEPIGYSGNTGRTTGPHLHFDVHVPLSGGTYKSVPIQFNVGEAKPVVLEAGITYRRP
jgi:murein DD-endopeptidase MepM/ murein hydrolase activator NlpD